MHDYAAYSIHASALHLVESAPFVKHAQKHL